VRFSAGDFTADIGFDEAGFVLEYPGIAQHDRDVAVRLISL
jgi:hypothetical protein